MAAFTSRSTQLPVGCNASVDPGGHGWLVVIWRGAISGLFFEPELAHFHIDGGELMVFSGCAVRKPVELLLRRVGFVPRQVRVEKHPDDPEGSSASTG